LWKADLIYHVSMWVGQMLLLIHCWFPTYRWITLYGKQEKLHLCEECILVDVSDLRHPWLTWQMEAKGTSKNIIVDGREFRQFAYPDQYLVRICKVDLLLLTIHTHTTRWEEPLYERSTVERLASWKFYFIIRYKLTYKSTYKL
jgi:hypothetical protein